MYVAIFIQILSSQLGRLRECEKTRVPAEFVNLGSACLRSACLFAVLDNRTLGLLTVVKPQQSWADQCRREP